MKLINNCYAVDNSISSEYCQHAALLSTHFLLGNHKGCDADKDQRMTRAS